MYLSNLYSVLLMAVMLVSLTQANIFQKLDGVLHNQVEDFKDEMSALRRNPLAAIKHWAPLNAAVRQMAVKLPMTLISAETNKKVHTPSLGFDWASCGPADQLVDIRNLTIGPSPLYFPGKLSFGFNIVFHDNIQRNAQVSASVNLQYSAQGGTWVTIPCVGNIGSCVYTDVCFLSRAIQCPPELTQKGIPCTCPINRGEYVLPNFDVEVDASIFISGQYKAKVVFTDSVLGQIACYTADITIG